MRGEQVLCGHLVGASRGDQDSTCLGPQGKRFFSTEIIPTRDVDAETLNPSVDSDVVRYRASLGVRQAQRGRRVRRALRWVLAPHLQTNPIRHRTGESGRSVESPRWFSL